MKESKRLDLIKILLEYVIEINKQQENFIEMLNEDDSLFNIDIYPKLPIPYSKIAELLSINNDEEIEEIYEFFDIANKSNVELAEEFCRKYDI